MAAGITDHCWTVRELLSLHVPPPRWTPPKQRGRRSGALQRLIERWCVMTTVSDTVGEFTKPAFLCWGQPRYIRGSWLFWTIRQQYR